MAARTPPKTTVLTGGTLDAPQTTSPGDAPADTYDKLERVSSAIPDKATAAAAGHQTVNTVKVVGTVPVDTPTGNRVEVYVSTKPDGTKVVVTRNVDTGVTSVATSIAVTPATTSVAVGATRALTVKNQAGVTLTAGIEFTSSDPTKATVSATGVITGVAAGTATITAKVGTLTATCAATVTA